MINLRVFHALVHESLFLDLHYKEVEEEHADEALPEGVGNVVPHLSIKSVELLKSLQVVFV